ncbi:hypothetical protein NDR87_31475 [Nocardia sp. CDC159]|uniref:Uncharacterized protein n=1 Tax=Nocardia pulmonis TaxID=2951408 RepID=A0A9X2EBL8_9NOCA|nr:MULTISPECIES: hypothetical protein [Nocardia]MCM6777929.1 hypothetical protein [Nocardia pulmonis]MCM6790900.1 hypothetical protein [Nocardia sp. CDC159]
MSTILVSGGVSAVLVSLVQAVAARRPRRLKSADYAEIAARVSNMGAEMSQKIAADLRRENEKLENKVDALARRVSELTDALWLAIRQIESTGQDASAMRAVLNGNPNKT